MTAIRGSLAPRFRFPLLGKPVERVFDAFPIEDFRIERLWAPFQQMLMVWMMGVFDRREIVFVTRRAANVFRWTAADSVQHTGQPEHHRVVELLLDLQYMIPAIAEVVEIVDRLRPGFANDIVEPRLSCVDRLRIPT